MERDDILEVSLICPTSCEEVFAKKCLTIADQNLEIQITNKGKDPVFIKSIIDLEGEGKPYRISNLMPNGLKELQEGESGSFYGYVDEDLLRKYSDVVLHDQEEKTYRYRIKLRGYS